MYVRRYSFPFLKIAFVVVFLVFFTLVARHLLLVPETLRFERLDKRSDLSQNVLQPGLNIDNLPLVKIDYGKYKPNTDVPGADAPPDESVSAAQIRQLCLSRGYYLGPENTDANCGEVCGVSDEAVAYTFLTPADTSRIVAAKQKLKPGAYCMPTRMATCNRNTSSVVYSLEGWLCLPRTDAFAGEGGNHIVVCNGSLRDNALRVVYTGSIPANLAFNDVYRDRLADGTYRFECPRTTRDEIGNHYLESPVNRLHQLRNWCTSSVPWAADGGVNWTTGRCECGTNGLVLDPNTDRCTSCRIHFDADTKQISFAQRPCFSFIDSVQQFEDRLKELRDQLNVPDDQLNQIAIFPCGYNTQGSSSEHTLPRCLDYFIAAYKPALPSHNTLQVIDSYA